MEFVKLLGKESLCCLALKRIVPMHLFLKSLKSTKGQSIFKLVIEALPSLKCHNFAKSSIEDIVTLEVIGTLEGAFVVVC